ncbi:MAG: hypothetical protein R3A45_00295 [Bdellovibrionota bacterium]
MCQENHKKIHLLGLVSTGNVHSAQEHYFELLTAIAKQNMPMQRCFFHSFLDGRDTPPRSAKKFMIALEEKLSQVGAKMASVSGRYYAMDRDQRWERTEKAYKVLVEGEGNQAPDAMTALENAYAQGLSDELSFLPS